MEPINAHILELLNMALELAPVIIKPADAEFQKTVKALKEKYTRLGWKGKGKEGEGIIDALIGLGDADGMSME